jgi:hypothetical protein
VINHKKLLPALSGRETRGAPLWRSQAGDRDPGADDGFHRAELQWSPEDLNDTLFTSLAQARVAVGC